MLRIGRFIGITEMSSETEASNYMRPLGGPSELQKPQLAVVHNALVLLGIALFLYFNLFVFGDVPVLQGDDQVFFWMDAQRMLHGERPYVDFFQYTPPGTDLLFLAIFKLWGPRIWVLNATVLALGTVLCWICFRLANQVLERRQALIATLLYLVLIIGKTLNATHHGFSVLAVLCAVYVLMPRSTRSRILVSGMLLGLAAFFTQTHGVAAALGLSAFLIYEQIYAKKEWRTLFVDPALLILGFVLCAFALNAHFIASAGARQLWYEQVVYVRRYAPRLWDIPNLGLPAPPTWHTLPLMAQQLFVYLMLPVVYTLSLLRSRYKPNDPVAWGCRKPLLLSLVGISLFLEVAISPNWLRIYAVSMPGIILLIWSVQKLGKSRRYLLAVLYSGMAFLALRQLWSRHHQQYIVCKLPAGRTAALPQTCDELLWMARHTKPGDFFFQAEWPGMYVPLALRNPLYLDTVGTNQQTRPEDVALAIRQLEERKVRYVLWSKRLGEADSSPDAANPLVPLKTYLFNRYDLVEDFPGHEELWQRK
jgi:hypothetical protein